MVKSDDDRTARIKKEILKAKDVAGIAPPRLIPRGEKFRSSTTSRPHGAISHELDLPMLRGKINDDVLATAAEPKAVSKAMATALGECRAAVIARIEKTLECLSDSKAPKLREMIAEQLNLAAATMPGDKNLTRLQAKFDEIRFTGVTFKDEDDMPGGGAPRG